MVVAIEGIVSKKEPSFVIIKCPNGLSYGVFISFFCANKLQVDQKCELLITQIIKEDSNKFYGFLDRDEQRMFQMLLKVNGIGANTAMALCSSLDVPCFYRALKLGDEAVFKKVPGIGAKSARRIIVELSDASLELEDVDEDRRQALAALLSLGFKQDRILGVLQNCNGENANEIIKEALKKLV